MRQKVDRSRAQTAQSLLLPLVCVQNGPARRASPAISVYSLRNVTGRNSGGQASSSSEPKVIAFPPAIVVRVGGTVVTKWGWGV